MSELPEDAQWRSLLASPADGAAEFLAPWRPEIDRRAALRLMAASLALAGVGGCSDAQAPKDRPVLSPPRGVPGVERGEALRFASALEWEGLGTGVLVKTQDGRPVLIEGNPLHPASLGAASVWAQAEILQLYDGERAKAPRETGAFRDWNAVEALFASWRAELGRGDGTHVLLPPSASPTVQRLIAALRQRFPAMRWHFYAALDVAQRLEGARLAFGRPLDPVLQLDRADLVVTVGGDLFSTGGCHLRHAADWAARRRDASRPPPRAVAAESTPSLWGARADTRIILRPRDVEGFLRALAGGLGVVPDAGEGAHPAAKRIAAELRQAGSRGLVAVGSEQPAAVHALANAVNARLGALGNTVRLIAPVLPSIADGESISDLAEALRQGSVSRLLCLCGNPAYDAPADCELAQLLPRAAHSVRLSPAADETAALCRWHLPQSHALESWGDCRAFDGTVAFRQPATEPLLPGWSLEEALGHLFEPQADGKTLLEGGWRESWNGDFASGFPRALEDGVLPGTAHAAEAVVLVPGWEGRLSRPAPPQGPVAILFQPDPSILDGRYAGNGWLQELPKPLTKQVWGNAALLAPQTAEAHGIRSGDVIAVETGGRRVEAPAWLLPGQAPDTVTLTLGGGRAKAGPIGTGVGFDAFAVRTTAAPWIAGGTLSPTGRRERLVSTELHHVPSGGGNAVRVVALGERAEAIDPQALPSLYEPWQYREHAWGMTIDLDACIGCNACAIACQSENNVAVVGPDQVALGREMHWLRVDRIYSGSADAPQTYFQPVPCMHCEQAPCEIACPVNATVHSAEGLNDMVYNRCIGTRACSNNCPYKVRRFNFLDYAVAEKAVPAQAHNPQVTVRDRGVMEKCTFCTQRISAARIAAGTENRPVRDGEVQTACQKACPTEAIRFGDINDAQSRVSEAKRSPRNYALLGELNTKPRTTYLARTAPVGDTG